MKSNPLRRFWALLLTLVMALTLSPAALAAPEGSVKIDNLAFSGLVDNHYALRMGEENARVSATFDILSTTENQFEFTWELSAADASEDASCVSLRSGTSQNTPGAKEVTNTLIANHPGQATLTLSYEFEHISCKVVVSPAIGVPALSVSVNPNTLLLAVDETETLTASASPYNATTDLQWKSSDESIARVDQDGRVTGVSIGGPVIITVIDAYTDRQATCTVTVHGGSTLTLNKEDLNITLNATDRSLIGTLNYYEGSNIVWESDHPEIVSVPASATTRSGSPVELTANAVGTATITAKPQGVADPPEAMIAQCVVTVTGEPVREVHISCPNTGFMSMGGAAWRLSATVVPSTASQAVTWSSSDTSVVTVDSNGRVTAVGPGQTTIVAASAVDPEVKDSYTIEVSGILFPKNATIFVDKTLNLSTKSDDFAGLERYGSAVTASPVIWTSSNPSIASVTGAGIVTGRYPGVSNVTVNVGTDYTAVCAITVEEDIAQVITASVDAGDMLKFSSFLSTLNARCVSKTGANLSYITNVTVATDEGVVYYNYISPDSPNHGVGASEKYYYTAPSGLRDAALISDMCFISKGGFDGESTISYTGYNVNSEPYNGKIIVTVRGSGDVTYLTAVDQPLAFRGDDFANMCLLKTGRSIRYVTFGQPSASSGTLYYQYSPAGQYSQKVTSSTRYYYSSNPSIDTLTFVPASNFSGKATIPYTCTDSSGASYSGNVTVNVYAPDGTTTSGVTYNIAPNQRVTMVPSDFNTVCRNKNGSTLNYILFDSLPASNQGVLYYDYSSSGNNERAAVDTRYYRSASSSQPRLDRVSFVPASGFTGTVTIPFTGYDNAGGRFTDKLIINVGEKNGGVQYTTTINRPVSFNAPDFNEDCQRIMNQGLDHVRFSLPSSREGILYYNYSSSRSNNTRVSSSTNYYRSGTSNAIANITFVPASNFTGVCSFSYTGYASGEGSYTGTVQITVEGGTAVSTGITYTGSSLPIALRTQDFQNACSAYTGGTLSYIQFNSLPTGAGRLYSSYTSASQTGTAAMVGTSYSVSGYPYISQLTFVPKAEYQGQAAMTYTGYDTQGRSFTGTVAISLSNSYCTTPFTDMTNHWAKASVEYLRQAGVVNGYSNNTVYGPYDNVTRGQFTLMICRAFGFPTSGNSASFRDVPSDSVFAGAIATAQSMGIVQGTGNNRFQPNSPITRQSAMTMICRAMEAAGRNVPAVSVSTLSSFGDGNQVSEHARSAVASLVYLGVVRGSTSNTLNPGAAISRAEMAVILHRVLTL